MREDDANALNVDDLAWSESVIYSGADFGKYNPDDLIGRKGFKIYKKMMMDDQVKAAVLFKRDAVTARDYIFEAPEELGEEEAAKRILVYEEAIKQMSGTFSNALNSVMSAMYNGFSLTEKLYKQIEVGGQLFWGIDALKIKPFDTFRFKVDAFGNIEALIQELNNEQQELNIDDFVYVVNREDIDTHYGSSELRECYRDWFSKDIAIKFRNIWLEKHATGYRWVEPSADSDKKLRVGSVEYLAIKDMLDNKTAGSGFILPSGYTMKFEFPSNNVSFEDAIVSSNMAIARCLLVPNLLGISEQGKFGSRALGDSQLDAFLWTLEALANNLSSALNTQLFGPIGEANWGDGQYPEFAFKPVSEKRKHEIIEKWLQMVDKKTVIATSKDEDHLRDLLEFPKKTDKDDATKNSITALDAPQITALTDIAGKIRSGRLEAETAILLIIHTLPLDKEDAEEFVNSITVDETINDGIGDGGDVGNGGVGADPDSGGVGDNGPRAIPTKAPPPQEESIVGRSTVTVTATKEAFSRAIKRVAFAVIAQNTDDITELAALKLAGVADQGIQAIFKDIQDPGELDIAKVVYPGRIKTKLRAVFKKALQRGWNLGQRHAQDEIDKARGQRFTRIDYERLDDKTDALIGPKSFLMSGKLSDDQANMIRNIVINGFKNSKTVEQIREEVYAAFAKEGWVDPDTVEIRTGKIVSEEVNVPNYRLKTIVRTALFEAINESRYAWFTDPALEGFVSAMEYSALLDSRTTPLCESLAGHIHDVKYWEDSNLKPPNHMNCRSMLVAVTERDEYAESELPDSTLQPHKGFG